MACFYLRFRAFLRSDHCLRAQLRSPSSPPKRVLRLDGAATAVFFSCRVYGSNATLGWFGGSGVKDLEHAYYTTAVLLYIDDVTTLYYYYYYSCHPTMFSMIFNMDHS